MSNLLNNRVTPLVSSVSAQPLTVTEIDEHIDGDRIWATIMDIRSFVNEEIDAGIEKATIAVQEDSIDPSLIDSVEQKFHELKEGFKLKTFNQFSTLLEKLLMECKT